MKVNVQNMEHAYLFDDIEAGEVFYDEENPRCFLLRTDHDVWVAVDIKDGIICHIEDFDRENAKYHIVKAEVTLS